MAGHYPLKKIDEPKIFKLINEIRKSIVVQGSIVKDFEKFKVTNKTTSFTVMKLSPDYVENRKNERAYMVGNFTLESIKDEHPSIIENISLEVHFEVSLTTVKIKNIFWVA